MKIDGMVNQFTPKQRDELMHLLKDVHGLSED